MGSVKKKQVKSNARERVEATMNLITGKYEVESRIELIQQLIPIGLMAVEEALQTEVQALAGIRYRRDDNPCKRWGSNSGSVHLGNQKHSIRVPRVRDQASGEKVPLKCYQALQSPRQINRQTLACVINGISMRKFEKATIQIPTVFSIQKSSVSRKFIQASAKQLKAFQDRDLSKHDIIVIFMDGKCFADNEIIIALGVTLGGEKIILGAIEAGTENKKVVWDFLIQLQERGLQSNREDPVCD
ncbi:transposase [bacterium AH-315-L15]|nr:transposase [bacterium AH-315-L15]